MAPELEAGAREPLRRGDRLELPLRTLEDAREQDAGDCSWFFQCMACLSCFVLGGGGLKAERPMDEPRHLRLSAASALWEIAELWADWHGHWGRRGGPRCVRPPEILVGDT